PVPGPSENPEYGRVQVLNAFVEGPPDSKPSETAEGRPVRTAASNARPVTARVRRWVSRSTLPLTVSLLSLLISGGGWIYTSFVSSSPAPIVGDSSKGGLGNTPAGQPAMNGTRNQSPSSGKESQAADDFRLIGRWRADVVEFGIRRTIIVQIKP